LELRTQNGLVYLERSQYFRSSCKRLEKSRVCSIIITKVISLINFDTIEEIVDRKENFEIVSFKKLENRDAE